jgi:hypothetical protein
VNFEDALFWLATLFYVLIAVRFAMMIRDIPDMLHKPRNWLLVQGQFKDGLLSAAIMWAIVLCKNAPGIRNALDLGGAVLLLWLTRRALHRIRTLHD